MIRENQLSGNIFVKRIICVAAAAMLTVTFMPTAANAKTSESVWVKTSKTEYENSEMTSKTYYEYNDDKLLETIKEYNEPSGALSRETSYTYDKKGNRTSAVFSSGGRWDYTYDRKGNMKSEVFTPAVGNGTTHEYTYDKNGNMLTDDETQSTSLGYSHVVYTYDDAGNLTLETTTVTYPKIGGQDRVTIWEYSYDENGNLAEAVNTDCNYDQRNETIKYYYDDAGNLTSKVTVYKSGLYTNAVYEYDENGNMVYETFTSCGNGSETKVYVTEYTYKLI